MYFGLELCDARVHTQSPDTVSFANPVLFYLYPPSCHIDKLQCVIFAHDFTVTHHFNLTRTNEICTENVYFVRRTLSNIGTPTKK